LPPIVAWPEGIPVVAGSGVMPGVEIPLPVALEGDGEVTVVVGTGIPGRSGIGSRLPD